MAGNVRTNTRRGITLLRLVLLTVILGGLTTGGLWVFRWGGMQTLQDYWQKHKQAEAAQAALEKVKNFREEDKLAIATRLESLGRSLTPKGAIPPSPRWKVTPIANKPGAYIVTATLRARGEEQPFTWNVTAEKGDVVPADENARRLGDIEKAVAEDETLNPSASPGAAPPPSGRVARANPFQPPAVPAGGKAPAGTPSGRPAGGFPSLHSRPRPSASGLPTLKPVDPQGASLDLELLGVTRLSNRVVALVRIQGHLEELKAGSTLPGGWKVQEIRPPGHSGSVLVVVRGKEKRVFRMPLVGAGPGSGAPPARPPDARPPTQDPPQGGPRPPEAPARGGGFPSLPPGGRPPPASPDAPGDGASPPPPPPPASPGGPEPSPSGP